MYFRISSHDLDFNPNLRFELRLFCSTVTSLITFPKYVFHVVTLNHNDVLIPYIFIFM